MRALVKGRSLVGIDLGGCPFCGGQISAAMEEGGVMHTFPMCPKFEAIDVLEFIAAVREARERKVAKA